MWRRLTRTPATEADRARQGFSLAETLVALIIVTMVSIIVATGVPSAIGAYHNAVAGSNAQAALSTVATALRDELGSATAVKQEGATVKYLCSEGYWATISNGAQGPVKTVQDSRLDNNGNGRSWSLVPGAQFATTKANRLQASYESIAFDATSHVFTITNLKVSDGDNDMAGIESLVVRAPYCEKQASS